MHGDNFRLFPVSEGNTTFSASTSTTAITARALTGPYLKSASIEVTA